MPLSNVQVSSAWVFPYQSLLLDEPCIWLQPCQSPAKYDSMCPLHDYLEVTDLNQLVRPDLTGIMLVTPNEVFFTDGIRYAGVAVVTQDKIIWAQSLIQGTSAEGAEL